MKKFAILALLVSAAAIAYAQFEQAKEQSNKDFDTTVITGDRAGSSGTGISAQVNAVRKSRAALSVQMPVLRQGVSASTCNCGHPNCHTFHYNGCPPPPPEPKPAESTFLPALRDKAAMWVGMIGGGLLGAFLGSAAGTGIAAMPILGAGLGAIAGLFLGMFMPVLTIALAGAAVGAMFLL